MKRKLLLMWHRSWYKGCIDMRDKYRALVEVWDENASRASQRIQELEMAEWNL